MKLDSLQTHIDTLSMKLFKAEIEAYNYMLEPTKVWMGKLFKF
jgi:hypothetical protein